MARDAEFRRALAAVEDGDLQGVVLVGESGVGKSTLARMLAKALESAGWTVRFALGTQTGSAVPLGAFSRAVTLDVAHEPALMLAAAHQTLEQDENLVVVVDDAQLLDPLSATLVNQLAASRSARLIVTIRSGEPVFDAVTALIKERLLLTVHVDPFTREQTGVLATAVLGGVVEARLIDALYERSGGNLVLLRGLLSASRESGAVVCADGCWQLRGPLQADRELYELLGFRLWSLTPEELEVVEVLAIAEVLEWKILRNVCDAGAVARLEQGGLIQMLADGSHTLAHLNDPVIGEVALRHAGVVRSRHLNGRLAKAFAKCLEVQGRNTQSPSMHGQIRLAQFTVRSDLDPDLNVVIEAAADALAMSDIALAEELSRFAVDRGGGLPAALLLGEALSWQGRADEAEIVLVDAEADAVLVDAEPDDADEWLFARWGCLRSANLFFGCGDAEVACRVLSEVKKRITSAIAVQLVNTLEMSMGFYSGDVATTIEIGPDFSESEMLPMAAVWAAVPTCGAFAAVGRFSQVHVMADAALRAAASCGLGLQRFNIGLAEVTAETAAGDCQAAERIWKHYAAMAAGVPEADAMVHAMLGLVHLARGALPAARTAFEESKSVFSRRFPAPWLMLVAAWQTVADAGLGDSGAAAAALDSAEKAYGPHVAVFLPELELARGWERASVGEMMVAQAHVVQAAQIAQSAGMHAVELRARHTAVRFGDSSHATRLEELAKILNTPLAGVVASHARGLADHDAGSVDAAARRFADLGALALAADASAQAAGEYARRGERGKKFESLLQTGAMAGRCGLHSPAVRAAARPLLFSTRERQIAMLVVTGLSNRQIADQLVVSVRTVEGHLYRLFAKLGITHRDQLINLLSGDPFGGTLLGFRPAT